jgi:transposase-like protein
VCSASSYSPEQRAEIIREVLEELYSPTDVARKYNISPHSIRDWIKKTGQPLPKTYKKMAPPLPTPAAAAASADYSGKAQPAAPAAG